MTYIVVVKYYAKKVEISRKINIEKITSNIDRVVATVLKCGMDLKAFLVNLEIKTRDQYLRVTDCDKLSSYLIYQSKVFDFNKPFVDAYDFKCVFNEDKFKASLTGKSRLFMKATSFCDQIYEILLEKVISK